MKIAIGIGLLCLGLLTYYFWSSTQSASEFIKNIDSEALKKIIKTNPDIQLVDVRTAKEIKNGMIDPAVHIDVYSSDFADRFSDFDKNEAVYIYCRSGMRSMKACKTLEKNGFTELYNLKGGYMGY